MGFDSFTLPMFNIYHISVLLVVVKKKKWQPYANLEISEIGCWMYASERQLARIRLAFLEAILNQEIGAFDTDLTSGKIITGVTNHMSIIQDAIGEKVILINLFLSSSEKEKN